MSPSLSPCHVKNLTPNKLCMPFLLFSVFCQFNLHTLFTEPKSVDEPVFLWVLFFFQPTPTFACLALRLCQMQLMKADPPLQSQLLSKQPLLVHGHSGADEVLPGLHAGTWALSHFLEGGSGNTQMTTVSSQIHTLPPWLMPGLGCSHHSKMSNRLKTDHLGNSCAREQRGVV